MASARKVVPLLSLAAFVLLLLYLFVRGWVEVGEERFWILPFVFVVPVPMAVVVIWTFNRHTWVARALFGISTLIVVPVLLVQAVLLADRIYQNPSAFRWFVPAILKAEELYIGIFPVEPHRYERHQEKKRKLSARASMGPISHDVAV